MLCAARPVYAVVPSNGHLPAGPDCNLSIESTPVVIDTSAGLIDSGLLLGSEHLLKH